MSKRRKRPRLPGIRRPSAELIGFERTVVAKCHARGLSGDDLIPAELVDEVVLERYGGWTGQARNFVRSIEAYSRRCG
jgi:hypothetical protein